MLCLVLDLDVVSSSSHNKWTLGLALTLKNALHLRDQNSLLKLLDGVKMIKETWDNEVTCDIPRHTDCIVPVCMSALCPAWGLLPR